MQTAVYQTHPAELQNEWGRISCIFYHRELPMTLLFRFLLNGLAEIEEKSYVHVRGVYCRLFLPLSGEIEVEVPRLGSLRMQPGRIYLLSDGLHFRVTYRQARFYFFHFTVRDFMDDSPFEKLTGQVPERNDPALFSVLAQAYEGGAESRPALQGALVTAIGYFLAPHLERMSLQLERRRRHNLAPVQQLILQTPPGKLSVKLLAETIGVSRSTVSREFKACYGIPLKRYLLEFQLKRARELLLGVGAPVATVAETLGFESAHYFFRFFKKYTGMTPGEFRKNFMHGEDCEFIGKLK